MRSDDMLVCYSRPCPVHNLRPGPANTLHTLRDHCSMCSPDRSRRT